MINQRGVIPILILIAAVALIAILGIAYVAPFKNGLLSSLFPKQSSEAASPTDWPQLQHDAQHTGRSTENVQASTYRLRWLWQGPQKTIRNHLSNSNWAGTVNINPGDIVDQKTPLLRNVPFTINGAVQPVIVGGKIFVGDMDGQVYSINTDDGTTLWQSSNKGGTLATAAYINNVIVWGSITGWLRGYDSASGSLLWEKDTGGTITGAPVTDGTNVFIGNHDHHVIAVNFATGQIIWISPDLGAPVVGGIALDSNTLYVGAENMNFYALNLADGSIKFTKKVKGQTFYTTWPVIQNGLVYIEAGTIPTIGSEYVLEGVMAASTSIDDEQNRVLDYLKGLGGAADASPDWQHLTVLKTADFSEPFIVPIPPFEGLGKPPYPPVVDNQNRVLTYFKTRYPTLTKVGIFGSNYSVDISAIDQTTGRRIPINNNKLGGIWWWDTDNLYIPSVSGNLLFLNHSYHRGIYTINLTNSNGKWIKTYHRQGIVNGSTEFSTQADITYLNDLYADGYVQTSQDSWGDRNASVISNGKIYASEYFGVVAIEPNQ